MHTHRKCTHTHAHSEPMAGCWWNLTSPETHRRAVTKILPRKKNEQKKKQKWNVPFPFPTPNFKQHAKSLAPRAETHWSVSSMEGSLPAPVPHNEFLLKPHLRGSFRKAGQAWIWNSKWSVFFSILAASPLSLSLKNMNRKILSLLFLLYNKRDLQYGRHPWQHCCRCWRPSESGLICNNVA